MPHDFYHAAIAIASTKINGPMKQIEIYVIILKKYERIF